MEVNQSEDYYSSLILEKVRKLEEERNKLLIKQNIRYEIILDDDIYSTANPFLNWIYNLDILEDSETLRIPGTLIPFLHKNTSYFEFIIRIINHKLKDSYFVCHEVESSEMYISFRYIKHIFTEKIEYDGRIQIYKDYHERNYNSGELESNEYISRINNEKEYYKNLIIKNMILNEEWEFGEDCLDKLINYKVQPENTNNNIEIVLEDVEETEYGEYCLEPGTDLLNYTIYIPVYLLEIKYDDTKEF